MDSWSSYIICFQVFLFPPSLVRMYSCYESSLDTSWMSPTQSPFVLTPWQERQKLHHHHFFQRPLIRWWVCARLVIITSFPTVCPSRKWAVHLMSSFLPLSYCFSVQRPINRFWCCDSSIESYVVDWLFFVLSTSFGSIYSFWTPWKVSLSRFLVETVHFCAVTFMLGASAWLQWWAAEISSGLWLIFHCALSLYIEVGLAVTIPSIFILQPQKFIKHLSLNTPVLLVICTPSCLYEFCVLSADDWWLCFVYFLVLLYHLGSWVPPSCSLLQPSVLEQGLNCHCCLVVRDVS